MAGEKKDSDGVNLLNLKHYPTSPNLPKRGSSIGQWTPRLKKRKLKCFLFLFQIILMRGEKFISSEAFAESR